MRLLGKDEVVRFLNVTLYQGAPSKKSLVTAVSLIFEVFVGLALIPVLRLWQLLPTPFFQKRPCVTQLSHVLALSVTDSLCLPGQSLSMLSDHFLLVTF